VIKSWKVEGKDEASWGILEVQQCFAEKKIQSRRRSWGTILRFFK